MSEGKLEQLSTLVSQPVPKPSWKEEVNRRLEAHKSRKGLSVVDQNLPAEEQGNVSDRAARAAARVAARYAKAPSFSEMQAAEARAALRTAEAATRAALEAQAMAQAALDHLDQVDETQAEFQDEPMVQAAVRDAVRKPEARAAKAAQTEGLEIRWEPDMPQLAAQEGLRMSADRDSNEESRPALSAPPVETVDAAEPIQANLIQFPRELVATRRMRPRLADSPGASTGELFGQLSIFEVDPSTISIEPQASVAQTSAPAPSWSGPEWAEIELSTRLDEETEFDGGPPAITSGPQLAPLELRMMAVAVDVALIVGLVCAAAAGMAGHLQHPPALKSAEMLGFTAVILTGILYQAFFLMAAASTPGMMYAGIALCTFDDEQPTRTQLRDRLGALLVSLIPMGLGLAWCIFDEDHLSWHDRLSRTYLRMR
jgi:uncharacterized RDD family membrane protein YckC